MPLDFELLLYLFLFHLFFLFFVFPQHELKEEHVGMFSFSFCVTFLTLLPSIFWWLSFFHGGAKKEMMVMMMIDSNLWKLWFLESCWFFFLTRDILRLIIFTLNKDLKGDIYDIRLSWKRRTLSHPCDEFLVGFGIGFRSEKNLNHSSPTWDVNHCPFLFNHSLFFRLMEFYAGWLMILCLFPANDLISHT